MFLSYLRRCSTTQRCTSHSRSRYTFIGVRRGVLEPSAIAATGLLAFFLRKSKRGLRLSLGALFALLLAFPIVFFWLVAPANAGFLAATLPSIPPNWTDLRSNWEMGHAIRFALQFAALSLLVLSLALDANTISYENK